jgi:type VII secretion protein EccE
MIQLAPNLDLPTVIAERTLYTEDTIPVDALLPMLDQFGIAVDIDIVTTGQRVRSTGSYSMLYDQLIGSHPVVGDRLTWLVVRLDQERNLAALRRRWPAPRIESQGVCASGVSRRTRCPPPPCRKRRACCTRASNSPISGKPGAIWSRRCRDGA